ncbi:MAG: RagB/SusD family nutrient uptake outer membrane protein [Duncaniella sp.]|jgi:tetratricopeptide (TPR) repeat protein
MKIKHIATGMLAGAMMMTSCADFTEIDPKGKNLLSSTADLELLLNAEYSVSTTDMQQVCGDVIYATSTLSTLLQPVVKTKFSILVGWDEAGHDNDLPELTASDSYYASCYEYIGRIANPILAKIDDASGSDTDRLAIKAEAYVVRAYFHYLAVQKFAPAYDKATAANTMALAYVKEDQDIKQPTVPVSLEEYYTNIIADIDAALSLNALSEMPLNRMRFGLGSAYAVKALALMAMQEPERAAVEAQNALNVNSTVANYNNMLVDTADPVGGSYKSIFRKKMECPEDYFSTDDINFFTSYPTWDLMEDGHAVRDHFNTMNKAYAPMGMDPSLMMIGVPGYTMTYDLTSSWPTIGLSTPQMYLILAENAIDNNRYDDAMGYLDAIRANRINPAAYAPLQGTVSDKATAITHLKTTAHAEGIFSVWNFINRKRWNRLDDYKETFTRTIYGIDMSLTPDSKLWVFPIPQNVINNNPNFTPYLN